MSNRLATETSPYLQQHADNPVDWYPWGDEAFERAQNEDKPILLSIGYSACHWCHVMAHECFENSEIASLMNEKFVNIKVDREERPDLDAIYTEAVQAMTGGGGWPLTVFLTPDGKPFFGGTYFPPEAGRGLPSLPQVLRTVAEAYKYRRDHVEQAARQITTALAAKFAATLSAEPLAPEVLRQAYLGLRRDFDGANGGFGAAPKFPQTMALEFLLRYFYRSKDTDALEMVDLTLDKMARGGIYDQVGGGFHRYATDSQWLVPHFEKMLYDNALLSQLYLHAYLVKGREFFRHIAEGTLDYVLREMTSPEGGFYSTQDADSEGSEGKYYLWLPEEITHLMGEEAGRVVNDYFGVTSEGNFDGRNILHVASHPPPGGAIIIEQAKVSLLKRRRLRVAPARDEKILASWNGLMLAGFAEAACILGRQDYLTAAVANGSFLLSYMISDGCLRHSYKDGQAKIDGYLEDYALVIEGLLALHQATFRGDWLRHAIRLTENMVKRFWDEETGAFYDTGQQHEGLFIRPRSTYDGALPSGSSGATMALLKVARLIDNPHFEQIAAQALRAMRDFMVNHPLGHGNWLSAADFYLSQPKEIAIIGPRDNPATSELLHALCNAWLPNKVVAAFDPNDPTPLSHLSLFRDRKMIDNQPTVYVCQRYACKTPVTDAEALLDQLREG